MLLRSCLIIAIQLVLGFEACSDPPNRDTTAYAQARDSAFARPINRSNIAFTIPNKRLLAENVAYDPVTASFFVGSTHFGNVWRRGANGSISEFIPTGRDGMWMVIGMKVDAPRRLLWVNSSAGTNFLGFKRADAGRAALFSYDLASASLAKKFIPSDTGAHFFNDLVVLRDGSVFVTDMAAGAIYRRARSAMRLERWLNLGQGSSPNGIAIDADERYLYVAVEDGITRIEIANRTVESVIANTRVYARGIDGLYWYDGSLIAIQGGRRNRVQRFTLSKDGASIVSADVVEANHPMFMNPTTGVIVGQALFVVANSQFDSFLPDGTLFPDDRLFETVILRVPLGGPGTGQ